MIARQTLLFWLFIVSLQAFTTSCSKDRNLTDLQKAYIQQPIEQSGSDRIWKEVHFKRISTAESFFGNSTSLHLTPEHKIYFGDRGEKVIRKLDLELNQVDQYGNGRGSGPGEFLRFYNSVIPDSDSNIWVADEDNGRITIINTNTREWETINTERPVRHVIPLNDGKSALDHPLLGLLTLYDADHQKIRDVEPYLISPENWQILMQGSFAVAEDHSFIKAHYFTNDFIRYSPDGNLIYFRRPIEPPPAISIRLEDNPNDIRDKPEIFRIKNYTSAVRIAGNQIHLLLSRLPNGYRIQDSVDVYQIENGDYIYSYRLPEAVSDFALNDKYLVGLTEETGFLTVWEIENNISKP